MQETPRLVAPTRRYVQILLVAVGLLLPVSVANAQEAPAAQPALQPVAQPPQAEDKTGPALDPEEQLAKDLAGEDWGEEGQPENYVPSKGPSEDGRAYNWIQMGYAALLMVLMLAFLGWLVRRTPRKSRDQGPESK